MTIMMMMITIIWLPFTESLWTKYGDKYFIHVMVFALRYKYLHFRNEQTESQRRLEMYPMSHRFIRGSDCSKSSCFSTIPCCPS